MPIELPCGQCIGCRVERTRQWALRCQHEASLYDENSFLTLTYDEQHVPYNYGLKPDDFVRFMKRLRKHLAPKRIRYFMSGEYGDENLRPHYHAILFNHQFEDRVRVPHDGDDPLYNSGTLMALWGLGNVAIGEVTYESARYVARYAIKKITGEKAESAYTRILDDTGEVFTVLPEYGNMSRKPGIGKRWWEQFKNDLYPSDFIVQNGQKMIPPKYYDKLLEENELFEIKQKRIRALSKLEHERTPEILEQKEKNLNAKLNLRKNK